MATILKKAGVMTSRATQRRFGRWIRLNSISSLSLRFTWCNCQGKKTKPIVIVGRVKTTPKDVTLEGLEEWPLADLVQGWAIFCHRQDKNMPGQFSFPRFHRRLVH